MAELSDEQVQRYADEAEAGYDPDLLVPRPDLTERARRVKILLAKRAGMEQDLVMLWQRRQRSASLIAAVDLTIADIRGKLAETDAALIELGVTPPPDPEEKPEDG